MPQFLLRAAGAVVTMFLCLASPAHAEPRAPAGRAPGGAFLLHNGGRCLDIDEAQLRVDGARVQLRDCRDRPSQRWRFEDGNIANEANGRCLDVHEPDAGTNGARIQVARCHGGATQAWRLDRGRLVAQVDGRCLDGNDPDDRTAQVQTWDCRADAQQQWRLEPARLDPPARDVEAGPIWNNADARQKCPSVCAPSRWTGHWRTTVQGRMSVCNCELDDDRRLPRLDDGPHGDDRRDAAHHPRPMSDERFDGLLAAMRAESFSHGAMRVLEDAARDNYFVVAQLQRVIEGMPFPSDRMRAVEVVAPRILDRHNAFNLYGAFGFESEKEQVRTIFDRLP